MIKKIVRKIYNVLIGKKSTSKQTDYLKSLPRFTPFEIIIDGKKMKGLDGPSFHFLYKEIFEEMLYAFHTEKEKPYIIDAGANIGMASIYLKRRFPNAEIVAFEPDPKIASVLRENLHSYGFNDVTVVEKGLANFDGELKFFSEGADAGHFIREETAIPSSVLPVVRLEPWLNKEVDFLKVDIEGAEVQVVEDIQPQLHLVKRIFIEYHSFVGEPQALQRLLSVLSENGFRYYLTTPGVNSKHPLKRIYPYMGMDMQVNIFGLKDVESVS